MEYRQFGRSGLRVPALSFGTATFGGNGNFWGHVGQTGTTEAARLIDVCLDAGINFFDTGDAYAGGASEAILGEALKGKRHQALIAGKAAFRVGEGANDVGSSRYHLVRTCEESLKRLLTDHIDVYFLHGFDALTPVDETLRALDDLVTSGKIGYIGASNFSGWHLMKSLAESKMNGLARYVVHQAYYSLIGREYEWELMPLALDQGIGLMAWSPLGFGRLTGKVRRDQPPQTGRIATGRGAGGPPADDDYVFAVVDVLDNLAKETGKTVSQISLNWLLNRPTVVNVIVGARNEEQLKENLGAIGWTLSDEQLAKLDDVSHREPIYPYWHQKKYDERNPKPTTW